MTSKIALIISVLVAEGLVLLGTRYVADIWHLYILYSVQVQVALALALASVVSLLLHRTIGTFLLLAASLAMALHGYLMLGEHGREATAQARPVLKVLSFNVLGSNGRNGAAIADMLVASGADVLFLQESASIGPQIPKIRAAYPYRLGCGAGTVTCDLSLWSRHPLTDGKVGTISPLFRDRMMTASVTIDGVAIRLVNAHLSKPYFDEAHAVEAKRLAEVIAGSNGPLVLAGDFNASSIAPDIRRMLAKTGLVHSPGEPATWPVPAVGIGVAIDHVYVRAPLAIRSVNRLDDPYGSNHFGLVAELALEP